MENIKEQLEELEAEVRDISDNQLPQLRKAIAQLTEKLGDLEEKIIAVSKYKQI